jgi:teichuronic acid biosynthesis glycosyltransferase TuaG
LDKSDVLVSVVVPTYNRCGLMLLTLESILSQTHRNMEILVIDDGSDDDTEVAVKGIQDKRIKYVSAGRTKDIARVRNLGIEHSTGEYIAFCDDDDLWIENKLEMQLSFTDDFKFVCSDFKTIDINGNVLDPELGVGFDENMIIDLKMLLMGNIVATSSVLINKKILTMRFSEKQSTTSAEDYELWLKLAENNVICYISTPLVLFRRHTNTSSFDYGEKYLSLLNEVINILSFYQRYPDHEVNKFARYGTLKQEKELCKLLFHNSSYFKFFIRSLFLFKELLHPSIVILFLKRKFCKMHVYKTVSG